MEVTDYFFGASSSLSSLFLEKGPYGAEAFSDSSQPVVEMTHSWPMALWESVGTEVSQAHLTLTAVLLVSAIPIVFSELFSEAFESKTVQHVLTQK